MISSRRKAWEGFESEFWKIINSDLDHDLNHWDSCLTCRADGELLFNAIRFAALNEVYNMCHEGTSVDVVCSEISKCLRDGVLK